MIDLILLCAAQCSCHPCSNDNNEAANYRQRNCEECIESQLCDEVSAMYLSAVSLYATTSVRNFTPVLPNVRLLAKDSPTEKLCMEAREGALAEEITGNEVNTYKCVQSPIRMLGILLTWYLLYLIYSGDVTFFFKI